MRKQMTASNINTGRLMSGKPLKKCIKNTAAIVSQSWEQVPMEELKW